ncbi:carbohydrate kinase [Luedemannella flava]|uniref:carbohydrate kinase family protein n=1 Tax=Luedemannella flava TaxID=349316 RepID=UPI0031D7944A
MDTTDPSPDAVVLGEALMDLLETPDTDSHTALTSEFANQDGSVFRPVVGGAPLNVAVGVARLGGSARFLGALSADELGRRIRALLGAAGVDTTGCPTSPAPTTLALTSFTGSEPDFHFYGDPPSYAAIDAGDVVERAIAGARTLYCGSIALLQPGPLAAAREAWSVRGPLRTFDPNVRPRLTPDPAALRAVVEEFAATAHLVKLSAPDARELFGLGPEQAAAHLLAAGAATVVVTLGAAGALVAHHTTVVRVPAPTVSAVDATGAGDATMAGLLFALARAGVPDDWRAHVAFATAVGALVCETPGGATAMPTLTAVRARFPGLPIPGLPEFSV